MSDLIQSPFLRQTYPGIDNPAFIDDILAADQGIQTMAAILSGLGPTDFAIISGLTYVPGVPNTFTPGYFYLNGVFYYIPTTVTEGQYLIPNVQGVLTKGFDDGNSRNIYNTNFAATSLTSTPTSSPQMMGNMNAYRMGLKYLGAAAVAFYALQASLGQGAYANFGSVAGTVAQGNDPRLVYNQAQLLALFAQISNVIVKGDTNAYTPQNPLDPVNKAYADATSGKRLASGSTNLGDADTGAGTIHTISLGTTITVPYTVLFSVLSLNANAGVDIFHQVTVRNKTQTSFDTYWREVVSGVQNVTLEWIIVAQ